MLRVPLRPGYSRLTSRVISLSCETSSVPSGRRGSAGLEVSCPWIELPLRNVTATRSPLVRVFQISSWAARPEARKGRRISEYLMPRLYHLPGTGSKTFLRFRVEHDPGGGHAVETKDYLRCFETSAVISNMLTCFLPLKTAFSTSSALIMRLFFWS